MPGLLALAAYKEHKKAEDRKDEIKDLKKENEKLKEKARRKEEPQVSSSTSVTASPANQNETTTQTQYIFVPQESPSTAVNGLLGFLPPPPPLDPVGQLLLNLIG